MNIAYKNAAKEVVRLFQPPKGWTLGDLKADLDRINAALGGGIRAYMALPQAASAQAGRSSA